MALLTGGILAGNVTGKLGGYIFSVRNGKTYVRPVQKRTGPVSEASKAQQDRFARAGKICRSLKLQIEESITVPAGHKIMHTKLMSSLVHWVAAYSKGMLKKGDNSEYFKDCVFINGNSVRERWQVPLEFSNPAMGMIRLKIPAFIPVDRLRVPPYTSHVECKIVVAGAMIIDGAPTGSCTTMLRIDYNDKEVPEKIIDLWVPAREGALMVTAMGLEYKLYNRGGGDKNHDTRFMPSGIMNAIYV